MEAIRPDIFGYFNSPEDETPSHDPGTDTICPICIKNLSAPRKTISLMRRGDAKSYFYRTHKGCYEGLTSEDVRNLESSLIDNLKPPTNE